MIDLHYDLLTYIYMKIKKNDIDYIKNHCRQIYANNITGGILNLFFMSKKEMEEELGIKEDELNVINMLRTVDEAIKKYNLIPNNNKFIYGIEGCDYLENPKDLEELYKLGIRSITPVWNQTNKFGSGNRGDGGLTALGAELIDTAVSLGIMIDLSHANSPTFWDIIKKCENLKNQGKNPVVIASHSNCRELCKKEPEYINNREDAQKTLYYSRNLDDEQLLAIKKLNGIVGIVTVKGLTKLTINKLDTEDKNNDNKYIESIKDQFKYLIKLFGDTKNIGVATDDMRIYGEYLNSGYYLNSNQFLLKNVAGCIEELLKNINCSNQEVKEIMYLNSENKLLQISQKA